MNIDKYSKTIFEWRYTPMANYICPTFKVTKNESNTPRGLALLSFLIENKKREFDEVSSRRMYQCTSCYLCTSLAYDDTDPASLFIAARADIVNSGKTPKSIIDLKDLLLKQNKVDVKEFKFYKKMADIGVFVDPYSLDLFSEEVKANLAILDRAGVNYSLIGLENSSGAQFFEIGFRDIAKKLAKININDMVSLGVKAIVFLSPFDYRAFSQWYDELDIEVPKNIKLIPFPSFLLKLVKDGKLTFKSNGPLKVTYHDSPNFARIKGSFLEIDDLLKQIPDIEFIPMYKNGVKANCDGGDFLPIVYPEIANVISKGRYEEAKETGADILLTSCFYSQKNLMNASDKDSIKVEDLGKFIFKYLS